MKRLALAFLLSVSLCGCARVSLNNQVVFLGDSITHRWDLATYFPDKAYLNAGIDGNNTSQMVARLAGDAIAYHPQKIIILGGTNDLTQDASFDQIEANLQAMCEQARNAKIIPILGTVMPRRGVYGGHNQQIVQLDGWIRNYGETAKIAIADYYSVVVDPNGDMNADMTYDGLHPNALGYEAMAPVAAAAIESAH